MDTRFELPMPPARRRSRWHALLAILRQVQLGFVRLWRDWRHPFGRSSAKDRPDSSATPELPTAADGRTMTMARLPLQRHTSALESMGLWLALAAALATASALSRTSLFALASLEAEAWDDLAGLWRFMMSGVLPLVAVIAVLPRWLPRRRLWRWPLTIATALLAAAAGWLVQDRMHMVCCGEPIQPGMVAITRHALVVIALLVAVMAEYRRGYLEAASALHQAAVDRMRLQGELAAGRLQVLQAQIEPHFLFNSLANVRRLLRVDGPAGRAMLEDLLRYLESALPRLRDDTPTLGREVEITRAFLGVQQVRMGSRLAVEFDVPETAARQTVPPMMLLTLVENALKHGVHPLPEGGRIRISASHGDGHLRLSVADTGRGLVFGQGSGTGLANVRARLKSMYGTDAALTLQMNAPRGVIATIELPWR